MSTNLQQAPARPVGLGRVPERRRARPKARWVAIAFLTPAWLYIAVFYLYPLIANVRMGFQDRKSVV